MIWNKARYAAYLASPHWKTRRHRALLDAGMCCERCFAYSPHPNGRGLLEVNHLSYERLGAELREDLQVLCRPCHADYHGVPYEPRPELSGFVHISRILPQVMGRLGFIYRERRD